MQKAEAHKYDLIVRKLAQVFEEMRERGLGDVLAKGGVGALLLAHALDHELVPGDKGADAQDREGTKFEYKVSITDQFNFQFGPRAECESPTKAVKKHFDGIDGAYCAKRQGERFTDIVYCPASSLVPFLCEHFETKKGKQLNKNVSLKRFAKLKGAKRVEPVRVAAA